MSKTHLSEINKVKRICGVVLNMVKNEVNSMPVLTAKSDDGSVKEYLEKNILLEKLDNMFETKNEEVDE